MNRLPERSLQAAEPSIPRRTFLQPKGCAPFRGGFMGPMGELVRSDLITNRSIRRQVLDCASLLAFRNRRTLRKRQRAAAVQDAGALNPGSWPKCVS